MLSEFQQRPSRKANLVFAISLGLASLMLAGSAFAYHTWLKSFVPATESEEDLDVEFAEELPEVEDEPEPAPEVEVSEPAPASVETAVVAAEPPPEPVALPTAIPDARPPESSGPMRVSGTQTGSHGVGAGSSQVAPVAAPSAPTAPRATTRAVATTISVRAGRPNFTCPEPEDVRAAGIAGVVLVHVQVTDAGELQRFDILRGHERLQEVVRACVRAHWREWSPATDATGAATAWAWRQPFVYRANNL